jgi:cell division protein FtsI/penicillin-binding protein 2
MASVRFLSLLFITSLLVLCIPLQGSPRAEVADSVTSSLFAQSAARALDREFPNRDISFLLLDAGTGELLAARWDHPEIPIPPGSLLKPFAALAYGQKHDHQYPIHNCRGIQSRCWRPRGHGNVDLTSAIAYSCNSYFRFLTEGLTADDVASTARHFGLELPGPDISGEAVAGLNSRWMISPVRLARAYVELAHQRGEPGVSQILDGMAESARHGTGAEVDRTLPIPNALVKTGTAACTHLHRAPGDGFTVALLPADNPKILLLVRQHGVPGAEAARTAGQMLRRIEE